MTAPEERWLPVVGYEGMYEVSDRGRVKHLTHVDAWGHLIDERILATSGATHQTVGLRRERKTVKYFVHRLMLTAFVGPCPDGMEALHGDDDPKNNLLENLRWGTRRENVADRLKNGRHALGERAGRAVLTASDVVAIRQRSKNESQRSLAREFGICHGTIWAIIERKKWKHVA